MSTEKPCYKGVKIMFSGKECCPRSLTFIHHFKEKTWSLSSFEDFRECAEKITFESDQRSLQIFLASQENFLNFSRNMQFL